MKLIWKLAIPQICIVVILGLIGFLVIGTAFNNMRDQYIQRIVNDNINSVARQVTLSEQLRQAEDLSTDAPNNILDVVDRFEPIMDLLPENYAVYANAKLIESLEDSSMHANHPRLGNFVQIAGLDDVGVDKLITPQLLESAKTGSAYQNYDQGTLAAFPLANHTGKQIGVIVLVIDTQGFFTQENMAAIVLALMLVGMIIAPALVLLLRVRALATKPLSNITQMIQDIAEDRADLTTTIPVKQNDEIGELAKWFNTLISKLSYIMNERRIMTNKIQDESERFEGMAHWYSSILDSVSLPIAVQDKRGNLTFVNSAMENHTCKPRDKVLGSPCFVNDNFDECQTPKCAVAALKKGAGQSKFEKNGHSYQINAAELKDRHGNSSGYVEVIQDVTQLEHLRVVAEAESHAKTIFLATMSHEMRTPLNAIIGMTTIGKRTEELEHKNYALDRIEESSSHLLGVINDILDMSKIEAGKMELSITEFNIEHLLQKVLSVISCKVEEKRLNFSIQVDPNTPHFVVGDDQRLSQVIINLLSNAVKFTPEGGNVDLIVTLLEEKDGLNTLQFDVRDTGVGIAPDKMDKLFKAFVQAESGINRKFGGTGLGLSISKRLVELMDGEIWVNSQLGAGSCFSFMIKIANSANILKSGLSANVDWSSKRVLLVSNMKEMRGCLGVTFGRFGINYNSASDGFTACKMLSDTNEHYDICLVDWHMPDNDAKKLIEWINAYKSQIGLNAVVLIANLSWDGVQELVKITGADFGLEKPVFSSHLVKCLNTLVGASDQRSATMVDADFSGKNLLLAEDVEINREIVVSLLEGTGLNIDCVENGAQALEKLEAEPTKYDLVFMDIQMPVMDGLEATRRIRAHEKDAFSNIAIIAITANVFKDDIENCINAGMDGHIAKPIDLEEMLTVLKKHLATPISKPQSSLDKS